MIEVTELELLLIAKKVAVITQAGGDDHQIVSPLRVLVENAQRRAITDYKYNQQIKNRTNHEFNSSTQGPEVG